MVWATEDEIARKRKSTKPNCIAAQLTGPLAKDMFDAPLSKWITIARELALLPSLVLDAGVPTCLFARSAHECRHGLQSRTVGSFPVSRAGK